MKTIKFKKTIVLHTIMVLIAGLALSSCELNEPNSIEQNNKIVDITVNNELYTAEVFDEVIEVADEAVDLYETNSTTLKSATLFGYNRLGECAIVTREIKQGTVYMEINFGDTNCLCADGRERRGKIIMNHQGRYKDSSLFITFAFVDFFVDNNQIIGQKTVEQTINADSQRVSTIVIDGSLVLPNNGGTIQYSSEKTRTIIVGTNTRTKRDDIIEITGHSLITTDTTQVSITIIEPLTRNNKTGCFMYIVKGVMQIVKNNEPVLTIDYGDGTCDNLAEVTQDGVTTTIEIKRKTKN